MTAHNLLNQLSPPLASWLPGAESVSVSADEQRPVSWPGATLSQPHVSSTHDPIGATTTAQGPYVSHTLILDERTRTQFKAPGQFIPPSDSARSHASPLGDVAGDGGALRGSTGRVAVNAFRRLEPSAAPGHIPITAPQLLAAAAARHGELGAGDAVLLGTGSADRTFRPGPDGYAYLLNPFMLQDDPAWAASDVEAVQAVQYLHSRGVRLLATDGEAMGPCENGAGIHWRGLGNGILSGEGCVGFERLLPRSAFFMFLALKVPRFSGARRAIGIIPGAER